MLDTFFLLVLKAGGETTNWEDKSDTSSFSWAAASNFLAKDEWETNKTFTYNYTWFKNNDNIRQLYTLCQKSWNKWYTLQRKKIRHIHPRNKLSSEYFWKWFATVSGKYIHPQNLGTTFPSFMSVFLSLSSLLETLLGGSCSSFQRKQQSRSEWQFSLSPQSWLFHIQ